MICALVFFDSLHVDGCSSSGVSRRPHITLQRASGLQVCRIRGSFDSPAICSLHLACGRLDDETTRNSTMPSTSPQTSSSSPQALHRIKHPNRKNFDQDANIHNFAPVARIMKLALPENAKIAKEAKECMQECVSEFISFITSEGTYSLAPYHRGYLNALQQAANQ